jgi:hypothetical protein
MATEPHKVTLVLEDDAVVVRLICPDSGCKPAQSCTECGWEAGDIGIERCECCPRDEDECWIKGWFDNLDALEMHDGECDLSGRTLPVPIECEWDGESLLWRVAGVAS